MLGKTQIKYIQSLRQKKYRHANGLYVIEGEKIVNEYIAPGYSLSNIYAVEEWLDENLALLRKKNLPFTKISERELKQISSLATPNKVVALARLPGLTTPEELSILLTKGLHLALETIQDPGNLGTIIRTADWFGVDSIICSDDCVDAYNPKVVQSAMGSLARVKIIYATDLTNLKGLSNLPVYAATLDGENIFEEKLPKNAIILIGNESKGLSESLIRTATKQISIPRFGKAESLNAAVAGAIILSHFRKLQTPNSKL